MRHPESPVTEDTRLNGVQGIVARRCACRGWIVGSESPNTANVDVVMKHQLEEPHRSWDREAWIERNSTTVEIPVATLRKTA